MSFLRLIRALRSAVVLMGFAVSVAALMPTAARAQTQADWRGFAVLYGFTEACDVLGFPVGGRVRVGATFRPSGIADNGPDTSLGFHGDYYAMAFVRQNGRLGNVRRIVQGSGLGTVTVIWSGETRLRVSGQWPNNTALNIDTPQMRMIGDVTGIDNVGDCGFSFEASLLRGR